jgi:beta-1,3-galactosyl-O-glycosyl-glycoprotein beta-1,6-N-acetylglucosaminyltransferase/N-acetyllactosaminide beta-1,6-N-acetylglucosaminyltransferase
MSFIHCRKWRKRWRSIETPVPYNLTVTKGPVHVLASRGYVDYVINSGVARALYEWLRPSQIPDETFFSTLNFNLKLGVPGSHAGTVEQSALGL